MPKQKSHKGLLKRVRVTKSGQIKIRRAHGRHLRSHKTADLQRSYRKARYASPTELKRLSKLLPNVKLDIASQQKRDEQVERRAKAQEDRQQRREGRTPEKKTTTRRTVRA
jgi:large subunit ribosomal protein L35